MDILKKLQEATADSEPSTLFDDLSILDKLLNSLAVKIANAIRSFMKDWIDYQIWHFKTFEFQIFILSLKKDIWNKVTNRTL